MSASSSSRPRVCEPGRALGVRTAAVWAALAVGLAGGPEAAAQPVCTPVVHVAGGRALVAPVVAGLREGGVRVAGNVAGPGAGHGAGMTGCGALTAVLAGVDRHVRVAIVDPDGRAVERIVDDI